MDALPQRTGGELEQALERWQSAVFGLALAKTGCRADAEDVFQETFLAYFRSGKKFRDAEHEKAWLLRTALNFSRRVTASSWRRKTAPLEEAPEGEFTFRDEEENEVWQALRELSEDYRVPIYLYYFQELSTREIARTMGLGEGAVRMRLSRGREQLRTRLKGAYFDET